MTSFIQQHSHCNPHFIYNYVNWLRSTATRPDSQLGSGRAEFYAPVWQFPTSFQAVGAAILLDPSSRLWSRWEGCSLFPIYRGEMESHSQWTGPHWYGAVLHSGLILQSGGRGMKCKAAGRQGRRWREAENKRLWQTSAVLGVRTTGLPPTSGPPTCTATTDRTSTEIRLNSSKQPQAPVWARPL